MKVIPDGLVTFLFTDIEGSTLLAQKFPDIMPSALGRHHDILQKTIESNNGHVFEIIGDAFCAAFSNPLDGILTACNIQRNLKIEEWGETPIKVRIGINTGEAKWNGKSYSGYMTLSRTQRVMSAAYGEQILISKDTYENVKDASHKDFSFRDMGERRLKSLIRPEHLYQILAEGLQAEFPPLKTLDARPNNLPFQTTSFIGRVKEMADIKQILPAARLLTLLGPGGTGKTRISLQVGADLIDEFPHGVWFVELAPLADPFLVASEICSVFNLKETGREKLIDTLIDYLKEKELLLIIDNCEHLAEECAGVTDQIIKKCAKVKIIVTSREILRIDGEKIYRVPALNVPDINKKYSVESIYEFESVKLFTERAVSVSPGFAISADKISSIALICSRLDGIPFAIELAAARVRSMPVTKLSERLSDRFSILTGGSRTALPRQQTLRAMIDWSFDLLNEKEKSLLIRLSVFSGKWTLESAEAVCSANGIEEFEVLDLLTSLFDKSLITFDEEKLYYRMLDTVKQYCTARLRENNEEEIYKDRHLKYYLLIAEETEPKLNEKAPGRWLIKLEEDYDNYREALRWSFEGQINIVDGQRLTGALRTFWALHGYYSEGTMWIEEALKLEPNNKSIRGKLLMGSGILAGRLGNYDTALKSLEEALKIYRELGCTSRIAIILDDLGIIYNEEGEYTKSILCYNEALQIYHSENNELGIANSYNNLGTVAHYQSRFPEAKDWYTKALEVYRSIGDKHDIATTLVNLGNLPLHNEEDYTSANEWFGEALIIFEENGDKYGIASSFISLGTLELFLNNFDKAKEYYKKAFEIFNEIGNKSGIAITLSNLGEIAFIQNDYQSAVKYLQNGLEVCREIGNKFNLAEILNTYGLVSQEIGNLDDAWKYFSESLTLRKCISDKSNTIQSLYAIGDFNYISGNFHKAATLFGAAEELLEKIVSPLPPYQSERYKKTTGLLRDKLGNEEFENLLNDGKKLDIDEAIKIALEN